MTTRIAERPEVEHGDPPAAKSNRTIRWAVGRVLTDLAIVAVAVPVGLRALSPSVRGGCGVDGENLALAAGLTYFAARAAWVVLKALNDAGERWLARLDPEASSKTPKP